MEITRKNWRQYIQNLAKADDKAAELVMTYLNQHEITSDAGFEAFTDYFYAVVTKYAEGASEMAAQAYESIAAAQGAFIQSAIPAATPEYGEIIRAIRGTMLLSDQPKALAQAAGRLVRRTGVDTTINNALRDGAEWAWVPSGDTCAFCMMLASEGWHKASKKAIKNGHAKHVHANCDCTYAVRFDGKSTVKGYDPDYYKAMYDDADGNTWEEKINSLRRKNYAANKDKINAQKRAAYKARKTNENVAISTNSGIIETRNVTDRYMSRGLRNSPAHILDENEIMSVKADAADINIPEELLRFNEGTRTGFNERTGFINIKGDILPDMESPLVRDRMSSKAVLAHEYYGHYLVDSKLKPGDWRDEFRASYRAALITPNLTDEDRRMLMLDAYERAKEAGVTVNYNREARRIIHGYDES